jgi:hypothetical protein
VTCHRTETAMPIPVVHSQVLPYTFPDFNIVTWKLRRTEVKSQTHFKTCLSQEGGSKSVKVALMEASLPLGPV